MEHDKSHFFVGQLVRHKLFDYRGVIVDVDPIYMESEEWYNEVARTRPPKDEPWYRVLVDEEDIETYVAQRNLGQDYLKEPVDHQDVDDYFKEFKDGRYISLQKDN